MNLLHLWKSSKPASEKEIQPDSDYVQQTLMYYLQVEPSIELE
jgi:hypothetical protein